MLRLSCSEIRCGGLIIACINLVGAVLTRITISTSFVVNLWEAILLETNDVPPPDVTTP